MGLCWRECDPTSHTTLPPPQIYWDGLLVASALTHKTRPIQPGGALMLGAEQVRRRWGRSAG